MRTSLGLGLSVTGVTVRFGDLVALDDVSLAVDSGEIVGLIGPNGSGKTTLVNVVTGFQAPTRGDVVLDGRTITKLRPDARPRAGLARTFQAVRLFGRMSVHENVEVAALAVGMRRGAARRTAIDVLEQLELTAVADVPALALPYGYERRVAIARAVATRPRFLLLDEPAAGLDEEETDELVDVLHNVRAAQQCGMLVIEHDMRLISNVCDRVHVLASGVTICEGSPGEVVADPRVIESYLGTSAGGGDHVPA